MAAISAAILSVFAISKSPIMAYSRIGGTALPILAAKPWPVTAPIRALTIWMAIMNGVVRNMVQPSA